MNPTATRRRLLRHAGLMAAVAALVGVGAAGCSNKAQQVYNDAPRTTVQNAAPAEVGNMPDGFSNFATKCDHGNRVYVIYHGDSGYGSLAVVPQDPSCQGQP